MTTTWLRAYHTSAFVLLFSAMASAQTSAPATTSTPPEESTRPATNTFTGDTGIWFVPTAEILPAGEFSVSGYRRGTNYIEGYTNVGDFAGTFAVGIKNRAEVFGSFLFDTRIDRDVYPLFVADPNFGGIIDRYPRVNQHWTGDNLGDFYVGGKFNFLSEYQQKPVALAVRGIVKLPTGKEDVGTSTGKTDFAIDGRQPLGTKPDMCTDVSGLRQGNCQAQITGLPGCQRAEVIFQIVSGVCGKTSSTTMSCVSGFNAASFMDRFPSAVF